MSIILNDEHNKIKCQKFTPEKEVNKMLDLAGYNYDLLGKTVLEFSFGSGNILIAIVKRYIEDALNQKTPVEQIALGLASDVYGLELDPELHRNCLEALNNLISEYGIPSVSWSLLCEDTLKWQTDVRFDFIIGNPPYIAYHDIDAENRRYIRENYNTCKKGKFDYCYAFLEKGTDLLKPHGKMVQLVPSNIYKNVFGQELRKKLLPGICKIWEYPDTQLFEATLTSSSIFLYERDTNLPTVQYKNTTDNEGLSIPRAALSAEKWVFQSQQSSAAKYVRFGNRYHASITVATQLNEAFVVSDDTSIEQGCLKRAAAPRSLRYQKAEYIIFPYFYKDRKIQRYSENDFHKLFPNAYKHLEVYKDRLKERDADTSAKWFEYGRSQALNHLKQEKILLSTVITNSVELYSLDANTIPYSGIFITVKDGKSKLEDAIRILQSSEFLEYIQKQGLNVNGRSKRITCKDINDYQFEEG